MSRARDVARDLYARQIENAGPAWRNTANLVRTGWETVWIKPAIDALEALIRATGYADEDEDT